MLKGRTALGFIAATHDLRFYTGEAASWWSFSSAMPQSPYSSQQLRRSGRPLHRKANEMCRELATTAFALALTFVATAGVAEEVGQNTFRVCADPNNLPFSNREREGFENKLAELVAHKLGTSLSYTWWAQRRGFIRNTLKAKDCDVVMGVPAHYDLVETTAPYYRSSYVFVTRADRNLNISSLEDPLLKTLKIGVHLIGDDGNNTPPAHVLGQQGLTHNVSGFRIYG